MPLKRLGEAQPEVEPVQGLKRVANRTSDSLGRVDKEDLLGKLAVYTLRSYDPERKGNYGVNPFATVDVLVVETGQVVQDWWAFSNLAKQFGEGLEIGESSPGRITSGPTKSGNGQWWGIDWAEDDADFEAAERAMQPAETAAPF